MPDELLDRLRRFHDDAFPQYREQFQTLVDEGQHPTTLFIGCSDSRLVPYLLTGAGPGELFLVRNVGAFIPPYDGSHGHHGTTAAIEFAVLNLQVRRIVVCGHSHCGAIKAMYGEVSPEAPNLNRWLDLGREALLPMQPGPEVLRRTEQRAVVRGVNVGRKHQKQTASEQGGIVSKELTIHLSNIAIAESLVVTERAVEKNVTSIFSKLDLAPTAEDHRRVLAVLTYVKAIGE